MSPTPRNVLCPALAGLALLLAGSPAARAADEVPSFKKRGEMEKEFIRKVGLAIIKAAHPTARKADLLDYKTTSPKKDRTDVHITMEYYGAVTRKRYVARIVVKCDSRDRDAWEVLNIDYEDNNTVPYSAKKVQALIREFNRK